MVIRKVYGISIESALVIAVNKAVGGAHYIDENGKSNIVLNDESMQNAQDYMSTLAHEVTHGLEKQGIVGDKGNQSENYANLVGDYAEGNYEFALENSGLGEVRDGDVNQHLGNHGDLVSKNTVKFWGELNRNDDIDFHLKREEVDKLINGTPEEQAEMRRLDLTRGLELRAACQDAQSAACSNAIENAKANKATLEEDAAPFDDVAYGQELESIRSELNDPSGANRNQDEALLYGAIGLIADFTPGVSDAKGLAEAETGIDYLLATIGFVPLAGDLVQKAAKAFDAGDVKLAQEYIQEARKTLDDSPGLLDYKHDAANSTDNLASSRGDLLDGEVDINPNDPPYDSREVRGELEAKYGKENVVSTTVPPTNKPNVKLAGKSHQVTGVVFDLKGFPIFDDVAQFDTRVSTSIDYGQQMKEASLQLSEAISSGIVSPTNFTSKQLEQIHTGSKQIDGLTWHHHQDSGRMQLVDRVLHDKTRHIGGNAIQDGR